MGAGLGWGRRWPWSWESVYLKALSSLFLCLSFFLPLLPLPTPVAGRSLSFPKPWQEGPTLLPQPWEEGPVPTGLQLLLLFFWAV